jgi:hypothetical protein
VRPTGRYFFKETSMTNIESEQKLDPKLLRQIRQIHRQRRRLAALGLDSVQPPPIVNRRTGATTEFGQRRAFDGAWVIEMLGASGCTKEEVAAAIFVLQPLLEHEVIIDKDLLGTLALFHEPQLLTVEQRRQRDADYNRSQFRIVE